MIAGTVANIATGSGLKILGYVAGRLIDGFFKNKEQTLQALADKRGHQIRLQSGSDDADDFTKHTRRVIAWMVSFTACFVVAYWALNFDHEVSMLIDSEKGIFGWLFGGKNQSKETVTLGQMIMNIWPLMEVMFGFYFTKVGKAS